MIIVVRTGTFFRMLDSLSLMAIKPTLFISCDWGRLDNHGQKPILLDSPQLLESLQLSYSRDHESCSRNYFAHGY